MKKLCIIAVVAGMFCGAVAGPCNDDTETSRCYLWDVKLTLKTVEPKAAKCGKVSRSLCGEDGSDPVYYLDSTTRKIKGFIWSCEYSCDMWNIVLWDEANKVAIIPYTGDENQTTVSAQDALIYGKKANKACASFSIAGDAIDVMACGMNGKLTRKAGVDCYVKSLSGSVCGNIAYVKKNTYKKATSRGGSLCEEPVEEILGDEFSAKSLTWCDACCFDNWCDDGEEAPEMVPCQGSWSMKFNKKLAAGKKGNIATLIPAYAR